jgi:hypothetical protein
MPCWRKEQAVLLDLPARFLYSRGINLYISMRLLCTTYRCIVRIATGVGGLLLVKLLIDSAALHTLIE